MITVVVPVYNVGNYLPKCMDSILAQTYTDYEVIIVDDGSTDGSGEVCEREAQRSDKIRVVHKPNGGLSSARNCGIDHAKGDYIIFPDPDDWVEPDYLEHLLAIKEREGADLSICAFYRFNDKMEKDPEFPNRTAVVLDTAAALRRLVLPSDFAGYAWNKLFSLKTIRENGLRFDEELPSLQDLHFCFRYFQYCRTVVVDPVPLYHYNTTSGVSAFTAPLSERRLKALDAYEKIAVLAKESCVPELEKVIHMMMYDRSLNYIFSYYWHHYKRPEVLSMLRGNLKRYRNSFFPNTIHSRKFNMMARIALVSPRAFYHTYYWFLCATGQKPDK